MPYEVDPSKRAIFEALAGGLRRFAHTPPLPSDPLLDKLANSPLARRTVLGAGGLGIALGALAITHPEALQLFLHHPDPEVISGATELLHILDSQPAEDQLRGGIINRGAKIDLAAARQQVIDNTNGQKNSLRVRVLGIGDSNFYTDGTKNDGVNNHPNPQDQPHSFIQAAKNTITPHLQDIGISSWESYTFAVPGAPSGDGYPTESRKYGLMSTEQFYNPNFLHLLEGQEGEEDVLNVVTISATGDDWRLLVKNALSFASFFSSLEHIEHATNADIATFKKLLAESDAIARSYGKNLQECFSQIAQINQRRKAKGLLDVKVVIAHPLSMLETERIPFRTLAGDDDTVQGMKDILVKVNPNDPHDDRHYIDIKKVQKGQQIAYLLTVAMYQQLSKRMQFVKDATGLEMIPLEWMGLESAPNFFFTDGHPGVQGTPMQSALFLNLFHDVSNTLGVTTLDHVAAIPSQIASIVKSITQAPAA